MKRKRLPPKPKSHDLDRETEQVPTKGATVQWVMSQPTFTLGVADARNGRGYHTDYDLWDTDGQWNYERGRMWGALAPRHLSLRINGKINPKAVLHWAREII